MNSPFHHAVRKLQESGHRITPQRLLILEHLYSKLSHPSAEDLYTSIYRERPKYVSRTTIYNNLRNLKKFGIIKELYIHHSGTARYDIHTEPHHHLYCVHCGNIEDYRGAAPVIAELGAGFRPESTYLEISGTCSACSRLQAQVKGIAI